MEEMERRQMALGHGCEEKMGLSKGGKERQGISDLLPERYSCPSW